MAATFGRQLIGVLAVLLLAIRAVAGPPTVSECDRHITEALKRWEVPGVAIVVVEADRVVILKGYGQRMLGRQEAVTPDTVFPLASCTKAFTSAATALLVDDGTLTWDDPVRRHLPTFHLADQNADALVTLRDLLCHRTGVDGHDFLWYRAPWDQDESIRRIGRMPAEGQFRGMFAYQSIMYMAAGRAIGKHHAQGWAGLVRERLLRPLEMKRTFLTGPEAAREEDRARGHRRNREGKLELTPDYSIPEPNAAGSVYSSARDLANWLRFQVGDGGFAGKRIVSAKNLAETHKPQIVIPKDRVTKALSPLSVQQSYAMGWIVQDYRGLLMLVHSGWIDGFRTQLTLLPEKQVGIAILSNSHGTRMNLAVSNWLIDRVIEAPEKDWNAYYLDLERLGEKEKQDGLRERDKLRNQRLAPTFSVAAYFGDYEHPAYGTCSIKLNGKRLIWEWSSFKEELLPFRHDVFEIQNQILGDPLLAFQGDPTGVTGLRVLDVLFKKK